MDISTTNEWNGYTLEEIRVKRIMCLTRIELEKSKLITSTQKLTNSDNRFASLPIIGKIYSALDYIDYASLAFSLGKRVMRIFRRKK